MTRLITTMAMIAFGLTACMADMADSEDVDAAELAARGGRGKKSGSYNCKPDKGVDMAAELTAAEVLSPLKAHLASAAGADESGSVEPYAYRFVDGAGAVLTVAPKLVQACPLAKSDDPYDFSVEGLEPDTEYSVTVLSRDSCNNTAESAPLLITTPPLASESAGPAVTAPVNARVTVFMGSSPGLLVYADDDTGMDRVEFFANGVRQWVYDYHTQGAHGWSDPEGEYYLALLDSALRGTTAEVEAHAYDVFGNVSISAATLNIPAQ